VAALVCKPLDAQKFRRRDRIFRHYDAEITAKTAERGKFPDLMFSSDAGRRADGKNSNALRPAGRLHGPIFVPS